MRPTQELTISGKIRRPRTPELSGDGCATARPRNILRCQAGGPAVEFAIVLPMLLLVLFGIYQLGTTLFLHNNMVNAAREAARQLAVGEVNVAGGEPPYAADTAQYVALDYLAYWGQSFSVSASDPSAPGEVSVTISIPLNEAAAPFMDVIGLSDLLEAEATVRKE